MRRIVHIIPNPLFFEYAVGGHIRHCLNNSEVLSKLSETYGASYIYLIHPRRDSSSSPLLTYISNLFYFFFLCISGTCLVYIRFGLFSIPFLLVYLSSLCRWRHSKLILEINSFSFNPSLLNQPLLQFFFKTLFRIPSRIFCVSCSTYELVSSLLDDKSRIELMPNFYLKSQLITPSSSSSTPNNALNPICLCFFSSFKDGYNILENVLYLNHLFESSDYPFKLHLYGDGDLKNDIVRRNLSHVSYCGVVDPSMVSSVMSSYDLNLVLSHRSTPQSPIKLFDALAAGTPSIFYSSPDLDYLINTGLSPGLRISSIDDLPCLVQKISSDPLLIPQLRQSLLATRHLCDESSFTQKVQDVFFI